MSDVTEEAPPADGVGYSCDRCGATLKTHMGLLVHQARWCKGTPKPKAEKAPAPKVQEKAPAVPAPAPPRPKKRVSCAHLLSPLWSQLAKLVPDVPAQRAMVWQAPAAGAALDAAVAGTFIDRWALQKFVAVEGKYHGVYDLVSLPALIIAVNRQPALFPVVQPALRNAIAANMEAVLDAKVEERVSEERLKAKAEKAGYVWETEEIIDGEKVKLNLIDRQLAFFFAEAQAQEPEKVAA